MTSSLMAGPMNFLQAHRIVTAFEGGEPLPFLLAMSGTPDTLDVFIRAAAAQRRRAAAVRTLPFNTLAQTLLADPAVGEREVFVLMPWDFVPEADWRSGVPSASLDLERLTVHAETVASRLRKRRAARLLYVPAPIPPLFPDSAAGASLERVLSATARALGAHMLPGEAFSLGSYLANGSPFAGARLGLVASEIVEHALGAATETGKVLVTDLDNVLWSGVVGEDGVEGLHSGPEGIGFRHFLYQTLLAKLKREGVCLTAVSRNDPDLARSPFRAGRLILAESDFVCITASYQAKSAQIVEIASCLNLGLDSFVFVDDNPVEIAEVSTQLPAVRCLRFPTQDDELPRFFADVSGCFSRSTVTTEDRERSELYRRRLEGMAPSEQNGADLQSFLRELEMRLVVRDRSRGDRARAVQLINKTNQFNLNGRRVTDDEVGELLTAGGRLFGASLSDRTGEHGEILACLIAPDGVVRSLVLSCRVFERRVEHAFVAWLSSLQSPPHAMQFARTERNEPFRRFLHDAALGAEENGTVRLDVRAFADAHDADLALFSLRVE